MNSVSREILLDGVEFVSVRESRFKTMRISATATIPLRKETVSHFALLSQVLTRSCGEYPDFTLLSKKLSTLYGASLECSVRKLSSNLALTFAVSGIDDKYALDGDSISLQLSELLCKVIFEPRFEDGTFVGEEIEQERRQLLDLADSEFGDKRRYSNNRLLELMCKDEPFGIKRYGSKELISTVTAEDLKNAWKTLLTEAKFTIIYIGDSSSDKAKEVFFSKFSQYTRNVQTDEFTFVRRAEKVQEFTEEMEVSQAKLLMGFRTDTITPEEDVTAMRLMCAILGGGANSKFFKNIREKESLCYYCFSRFHRSVGIITVESGIEAANIEKTRSAVMRELNEMQSGNITDEEIEFAKRSVANDFISICDTVSGIEEWYLSQLSDGQYLSVEQATEDFMKVTKEELVACANKVTLDTVFVLRGKEDK